MVKVGGLIGPGVWLSELRAIIAISFAWFSYWPLHCTGLHHCVCPMNHPESRKECLIYLRGHKFSKLATPGLCDLDIYIIPQV